ncbi:MAG: hypothetical protein ABI682_02975 [Acidobacteriota bacterium]
MSPRKPQKTLALPIRSPRASGTTAGSLGRLWAEFTDPGPAGDTPVFLKKYAEGFVPGCMGLPFLGAGIAVMTLASHRIDAADKKTFLPILFGGVFALAGVLVTTLGAKTILRKSGAPAPRNGAPWSSDNDWDTAGAVPDGSGSGFRAVVGRLVFFLFIGFLNFLWTVHMAAGARVIVSLVLGLFDLVAVLVLYDTLRRMVQAVRVGTPRLAWRSFPSFTGGRFEAVFQTTRAMRPNGPPSVTLRRIEQRLNDASADTADTADADDAGDSENAEHVPAAAAAMRAYEAWSATQTFPAFAQGTMTSFPITMDVPVDQPGTDLSKDQCTYWQLAVSVPVVGPDLEAVFLVPIYERPK